MKITGLALARLVTESGLRLETESKNGKRSYKLFYGSEYGGTLLHTAIGLHDAHEWILGYKSGVTCERGKRLIEEVRFEATTGSA